MNFGGGRKPKVKELTPIEVKAGSGLRSGSLNVSQRRFAWEVLLEVRLKRTSGPLKRGRTCLGKRAKVTELTQVARLVELGSGGGRSTESFRLRVRKMFEVCLRLPEVRRGVLVVKAFCWAVRDFRRNINVRRVGLEK